MLLLIIFVLFDLFFTTLANYEYICNKNILRKPYLNIYDTRHGNILQVNGKDGFYDVSHLKNIYVCINGPAWLFIKHYTKIKSLASEVYDEPKHDVWVHECKFFNGMGGPGSSMKKPDQLKAIYMLGDESDYARPSLALFTAPYLIKEKENSVYKNVTSLVMINAHQCQILKGPNKIPMRFDVELKDGEAKVERMCLFPYQDVKSWVKEEPGGADTGDAPQGPQETAAKFFLINNDGITKDKCSNQNEKNARTVSQIIDNINSIKTESDNSSTAFIAEFNTEPTEKKAEIETIEENIENLKKDNPDWMKTHKAQIEDLEKQLPKLKLQQDYFNMFKQIKPGTDNLFKNLNIYADTDFDKINAAQTAVELQTAEITRLNQERVNLLNNITLSEIQKDEVYTKLAGDFRTIKLLLEEKQTELEKELKDVILKESHMEVHLMKLNEMVKRLRLLKTTSEQDGVKERNNNGNILPHRIVIDKEKTDQTCTKLPEVGRQDYFAPAEGSCNTKRGQKLMGCQLLRASMGNPGICSYKPEEVDKPLDDKPPEDDPADARLFNNFTITDVPTESKLKFWGKIMEALIDCKKHKHELIFRKESQKSNKYYLYKEKQGSDDEEYFDVPFMKEQADNEFGFNFAIDMSWKIFATVLGLCMPSYETKIPLITTRFFTLYTEEFLQPLAVIWTSTNDNNVFKRVLSSYYGVGGSEPWASYCMEGSFIYSSDISYRPPRKLLVNDMSEYNYFVGKDGKYKPVKRPSSGCTAACKDKKS